MRVQRLALFLILGIISQLGWAPLPEKTELEKREIAKKLAEEAAAKRAARLAGGATAFPDIDISKCDLKPSDQTKMKIKDKSGKEHFICSGPAICEGRTVPVSCKVSEKELCPVAKKCVEFVSPGSITKVIDCKGTITLKIKNYLHIVNANPVVKKEFKIAPGCRVDYTGSREKEEFVISSHLTGDPLFSGEGEGKQNFQFRLYFGTKMVNSDPPDSIQIWHADYAYQNLVFPLVFKTPYFDSYELKEIIVNGKKIRRLILNSKATRKIEIAFPKPEGGNVRVIMDLKENGVNLEAEGIPSPIQ